MNDLRLVRVREKGKDILAGLLCEYQKELQVYSIAEFYVVPSARGKGVGESAAKLVFRQFSGNWEVAQMETNIPAIHFWRKTIRAFTKGRYEEIFVDSEVWRGPFQTFRVM